MIKQENGVTLTVLSITIIIMFILIGVTINSSYETINETKNDKYAIELGMVRQAISEQYIKASTFNKLNVNVSANKVEFWKGTPIEKFNNLPNRSELANGNEEKIEQFYDIAEKYNINDCVYQEDVYYELSNEDLESLGISDAKDKYIVNYKTKEIYNETKKVNKSNELIYLPGSN